MYSALDIATWFLTEGEACIGAGISNMKLQKLLYYAQGAFLALKNEALFKEDIRAWDHGPVVPQVYKKYKDFKSSVIKADGVVKLDIDDEYLLKEICDIYGSYSAIDLRNMSHEEGPWKDTKRYDVIDNQKIKDHFASKVFSSVLTDNVFDKIPVLEEKRNEKGRLVYPA
ncbi:Panacea domain-containing protein [Christensenella minuta]|uniref:Panacea domain-containing protein n=1 Tax=Christensenella minuta TaxID=626937 RepID=UPI002157AB6B|nr:type II toxin-antitoxin system antitoxin SocA domain-containing protein [Christensenella minuta]MDY3750562.1 DUF4065 domain-containing protein [Christensenella minuta]